MPIHGTCKECHVPTISYVCIACESRRTRVAKNILEELAETSPGHMEESAGQVECFFCGNPLAFQDGKNKHKEDCLWLRAKKFMEESG